MHSIPAGPFSHSNQNSDSTRTYCAARVCQTRHRLYRKTAGGRRQAGAPLPQAQGGQGGVAMFHHLYHLLFLLLLEKKKFKNGSSFCFFSLCLLLLSLFQHFWEFCMFSQFTYFPDGVFIFPNPSARISSTHANSPKPGSSDLSPCLPALTNPSQFTISWVFPELTQQAGYSAPSL